MDASLNSAPLLALILVADFAITSLHSYQELKGVGAPLWRNFGAIAGLDVPDRLGFLFFTVVLTLTWAAQSGSPADDSWAKTAFRAG